MAFDRCLIKDYLLITYLRSADNDHNLRLQSASFILACGFILILDRTVKYAP